MSARWCEQHQRLECRSLTATLDAYCHSPSLAKGMDMCWRHYTRRQSETYRLVHDAVEDGTLTRLDACELCGARAAFAHHEDYYRPLDVIWLCGPCHARVHNVHNGLPAYAGWLRAQLAGAERLLASRDLERAS